MTNTSAFQKETDLCAAFIAAIPETWTAYPETGGFDILLVRKSDGFQIGVEAKLRLNAKVISQAAESMYPGRYGHDRPGSDCRAVLIPDGVSYELSAVCDLIGITVILMHHGAESRWRRDRFHPELPEAGADQWRWTELCPTRRLEVPDWVPDVKAGASAPLALTSWKVGAIKLVITLQRRGYLTRGDFVHFRISMSRWTQQGWLVKDGQGGWIAGPYLPDFRAQHPINFDQIAAEFEKWKSPATATRRGLFVGAA